MKIVPLGEVSLSILDLIKEELKPTFRILSDITEEFPLPKTAFNKFREQYRSEELLNYIEKNFKERTFAVTHEDLYTGDLNFVFGQAKIGGRSAILSLKRLHPTFFKQPRNETLFEQRFIKESIHEVGHMLGLRHCPNKGCVMNYSNTIGEVDKKTKNLCDMCKIQLGL